MKTIIYGKRNYHKDGSYDRVETILYNNKIISIQVAYYSKPEELNPAIFLDL